EVVFRVGEVRKLAQVFPRVEPVSPLGARLELFGDADRCAGGVFRASGGIGARRSRELDEYRTLDLDHALGHREGDTRSRDDLDAVCGAFDGGGDALVLNVE